MEHGEARPTRLVAGWLSALVPGAGQLASGALALGVALVLLSGALVVAALAAVDRADVRSLALAALSERTIVLVLAVNAAVLLFRGAAVADAYRRGRRSLLPRLPAALALTSLALFVVAPHAVVAWYGVVTLDTLESVFTDEEPVDRLPSDGTGPFVDPAALTPAPPEQEPVRAPSAVSGRWTTLLLLGGDAGPGRFGLRTDTMIVVALQEGTGRAAAFGVPRNLAGVPLPGRAGAEIGRFPDILNAVYAFGRRRPELFPGGRDPGATAIKQNVSNLLAVRIDYYALVDLRGFVEVIDALGGVRVHATDRVRDTTSPAYEGEPWTPIDVYPGRTYELDGRHALAYARSRWQSNDYKRMRRQRCLLSDVAEQLELGMVLFSFDAIARAVRRNVSTDIPLARAPELARLVALVDPGRTVTVSFGPPDYSTAVVNGSPVPDIARIRSTARDAILLAPSELRRRAGIGTMRRDC
jgi:LCP family protein required for cell wall assembly